MSKDEIKAINVDMSCDANCGECERYFDCTSTEKKSWVGGRLEQSREAMGKIKHKILVLGGKGGVGKTIAAVNLAAALAAKGKKVSILDQNFDGPCIPKMLGLEGKRLTMGEKGILPLVGPLGIQVVSMGLILGEDEVLTWFHDMKRNAVEEFVSHVEYGERDYLIVDVPAGTSSETVNVIKYIPDMDGCVVLTVPSIVSQGVARKATILAQKAKVRVFGVLENMSGFVCSKCNERVDILQSGGGEMLAQELGIPFLGKIPLDSKIAHSSDEGIPFVIKYPDSLSARVIMDVAERIDSELSK